MNPRDLIKQTLTLSEHIQDAYLKDLTDADLLLVPVAGMNPIAHQLGHLISSERRMVEGLRPGTSPELPAGFDETHSLKEPIPAKFGPKAEYLRLFAAQRAATRSLLDLLTDEELATPNTGPMAQMAPTWGNLLNMTGLHTMMHLGQYVAVRRATGKPVAI